MCLSYDWLHCKQAASGILRYSSRASATRASNARGPCGNRLVGFRTHVCRPRHSDAGIACLARRQSMRSHSRAALALLAVVPASSQGQALWAALVLLWCRLHDVVAHVFAACQFKLRLGAAEHERISSTKIMFPNGQPPPALRAASSLLAPLSTSRMNQVHLAPTLSTSCWPMSRRRWHFC